MPRRKRAPQIPKIKQLPSGRWNCCVMVSGKRVSITEDDYNECVSRALELVSKRLVRSEPVENRARTVSLRDAINSYIEARNAILSPSTIRGYKKIRDLRFQSVMDKRLSDIKNWQAIINAESRLCSAKTLWNSWGLVKSVLKENNISTPEVRLPQIVKNEHEFLQPEQVTELLDIIKGEKYELVYLLGLHGLRSSEILGLDAEKNLTEDVIRIRGAKVQTETAKGAVKYIQKDSNKTADSRRDVPVMIPRLKEIIKDCRESRNSGKESRNNSRNKLQDMIPDHPEAARKRLNRICKNNGLPEVGLHGLRHSFASLCYHLGLSEMETMKLGGWSDPGVMRKIYTHLSEKDKLNAENKLKNFFEKGGL